MEKCTIVLPDAVIKDFKKSMTIRTRFLAQ